MRMFLGGIAHFTVRNNYGETIPGGGSLPSSTTNNADVWYHYAAVFNGTASFRKIYIDGVVVTNSVGTPWGVTINTNCHLMLGAAENNAGAIVNYWPGKLYDVRIYNAPLTAADVADLMNPASTAAYEATMVSFGLPGLPATIDQNARTVAWTVPYEMAVTNLASQYGISFEAACDKLSGSVQDFTTPQPYVVVSRNKQATNTYVVTVTVAPPSAAKDILSFGPGAFISGTNILWPVPEGADLANLAPTYTVSPLATGNPPSGSTNSFVTPRTYTVTAQDSSRKDYVVTATMQLSTNTELTVRDGLIVWLKADAVDTNDTANQVRVSGSDIYVRQWNDQGFYVHDATNDVESDQPQYIDGALNGRPVLRFLQIDDNTGSKMFIGDLSDHFPSGATLFVVGTVSNDARYNLFGNRNDNDERWVADTWGESRPGSFRANRSTASTFTSNNWPTTGSHVFSLESDFAVYRIQLNGTNLGYDTAQYHSGSNANWVVGNSACGNGQQFQGDIPELILYDRVLGSEEAKQVGGYLAAKYGLATVYPSLAWLPEARIVNFGSPSNEAVIAGTNIAWTVPYGTDVTSLGPTYLLSAGATCDKASGSPQNFTAPVTYRIVSSDAHVTNVYTVTVTVTGASSARDILTFGLPGNTGAIAGTSIIWSVPYSWDLRQLAPEYTVSPFALGDPPSGSTNDFTTPVTYTVTAQDLSTKSYTVTAIPRPKLGWPITNGLAVWLKADAINTGDTSQVRMDGSSIYVTQWNDQSGNGQNASQATDTNQPEYLAGDLNGYPTVKWDGLGKCLSGPSNAAIKTVFFTCKVDADLTSYDGMFCQSPSADAQGIMGYATAWRQGYNDVYFDNNNNGATRINGAATYTHNGLWHILRMVSASTPSFTYQLGQRAYGRFWNGRMAEFIAYNRAMSDEEAFAVEEYLSRKYWGGVYITNAPFAVTMGSDIVVAGTNSETIVGDMWISNAANDAVVTFAAPVPASDGWTSPSVPAVYGNNLVWVFGTNSEGYVARDMIQVIGVPEPAAAALLCVLGIRLLAPGALVRLCVGRKRTR